MEKLSNRDLIDNDRSFRVRIKEPVYSGRYKLLNVFLVHEDPDFQDIVTLSWVPPPQLNAVPTFPETLNMRPKKNTFDPSKNDFNISEYYLRLKSFKKKANRLHSGRPRASRGKFLNYLF